MKNENCAIRTVKNHARFKKTKEKECNGIHSLAELLAIKFSCK